MIENLSEYFEVEQEIFDLSFFVQILSLTIERQRKWLKSKHCIIPKHVI